MNRVDKKNILITGSSDGIGKIAAQKLVEDGHLIFLHGRNEDKLKAVKEALTQKNPHAQIECYIADLSRPDEIRAMAEGIKESGRTIDVLINNAGVYLSEMEKNLEGKDMRFAANYIAPFILTNELLQNSSLSPRARIINVCSAAQQDIDLAALRGLSQLTASDAYAQSKLALSLWSKYMAKRHTDQTWISVNPGSLLDTKMVAEAFGHHWSPAEKGGNILYELATDAEHKSKTGQYYDNDKGCYGHLKDSNYTADKIQKLIGETEKWIEGGKA